ncbi:hypothetical protein IFM89_011443 [Coptis chinensis]|uniref:Receptor ligand binding region domain-containing protein n=1 Tax=Coptis chinensis TaxID=261450 RepID=A0A835IV76_9MAGN|nr:hypothetical protein IFM89_011443 [Coptis chinensis]
MKEIVIATVAAGALFAWSVVISLFSSGSEDDDKMMKAPGRDAKIKRRDFENNPRGYFRDLRGKPPEQDYRKILLGVMVHIRSWLFSAADEAGIGVYLDFIAIHDNYKTRLVLHTRDSKLDIILAAFAEDQIVEELQKLMIMQTSVFIVHMSAPFGVKSSKDLGMMNEGYVWILTSGLMNVLDILEPTVLDSMQGALGVVPYIARSEKLDNFNTRWKRESFIGKEMINFGLWAYDTIWALAMAAERVGDMKPNSLSGWNQMETLLMSLLQPSAFRILNVVGKGGRDVGFWTSKHGISRDLMNLNSEGPYSTSAEHFQVIIWPGESTTVPKGWAIPMNGKKLRIGVPVPEGFSELVNVEKDPYTNSTRVSGYCIDVFKSAIESLPYTLPYEFVPFQREDGKSAGSYNDLIYQVHLKGGNGNMKPPGSLRKLILFSGNDYLGLSSRSTTTWDGSKEVLHQIFMELSHLFFNGAPELHLANFLHMITTMAESDSTEEHTEFFIDLGEREDKPLSRGSVTLEYFPRSLTPRNGMSRIQENWGVVRLAGATSCQHESRKLSTRRVMRIGNCTPWQSKELLIFLIFLIFKAKLQNSCRLPSTSSNSKASLLPSTTGKKFYGGIGILPSKKGRSHFHVDNVPTEATPTEKAVLETVVKVTHEKPKKDDTLEKNGTRPFQFQDVANVATEATPTEKTGSGVAILVDGVAWGREDVIVTMAITTTCFVILLRSFALHHMQWICDKLTILCSSTRLHALNVQVYALPPIPAANVQAYTVTLLQ